MVEKSFSPWKEAIIFPQIFLSVECETFYIPPRWNSLDFSSMGEEKNKQQEGQHAATALVLATA
jgi:hypothetical protein